MKRMRVSVGVICVVVLLLGVGSGMAADIFRPGNFFPSFPDSELWLIDQYEWTGNPGNHAVAAVDYGEGWLYGAEVDAGGTPTAYYVWDMVTGGLWIGIPDPFTAFVVWQQVQ